ncbi:MAG: (Fe-S)-binding protein [Candidatus Thiodiazotropha sp. 6PLUC4]
MTPEDLLAEADRCVKCGLCLPVCPTYRLLASEADSPRGRISLIQALVREEIDLHSNIEIHLDRCLSCRACESACPSGVRYGKLLDTSREVITTKHHHRYLLKSVIDQLSSVRRINIWNRVFQIFRRSGLVALASYLPLPRIRRLLSIADHLPSKPSHRAGFYPASKPTGRSVQLFTGCVGSQVEDRLIQSTLQILSRLGYAVDIPVEDSCCGALHRHNGYAADAEQHCDTVRQQTLRSSAQYLLTIATACHLELDEQSASNLPLISVTDLLLQLPVGDFPPLKPLHKKAAIHIPCSARSDRTRELLSKIPDLQLLELEENGLCCGAAGSYMLTQPELSLRLGQAKIDSLKASGADLLITTNTGCAMQFRQLIKEADLSIEVFHPIELILNQWNDNPKG